MCEKNCGTCPNIGAFTITPSDKIVMEIKAWLDEWLELLDLTPSLDFSSFSNQEIRNILSQSGVYEKNIKTAA